MLSQVIPYPGVPFASRQFLKATLPSTEVLVPVFNFWRGRSLFWTPGGLFLSLSVGESYVFTRNSLTGSPIYEPSFPTSHSTHDQSLRAGFQLFRGPFPIPDPRRAVL